MEGYEHRAMSTSRRTPGIFSSPPPRDKDAKKLCRNCHGPLKRKGQHNCSPACSEAWAIKTTPALMRRAIFERDHGVCANCRVNTQTQKEEYVRLKYRDEKDAFLKMAGVSWTRSYGDWWDADHILPVIEGGGECGLENMRTLCIPCHKKVTRELRRRIADQAKQKRALERDCSGLFADQVES
jgi:5-methylcytosine-specific restriction endonuclease McrA